MNETKGDLDEAERELDSIAKEEQVCLKNIVGKNSSVKAVNARIAALTKKMETESLRPDQERDTHNEITKLKRSIEYVERLDILRPRKEAALEKRDVARKPRKALYEKLKKCREILDRMTEDRKINDALREDMKGDLNKIEDKIQEIKKEKGELFNKKSEFKEAHFKAMYEWSIDNDKYRVLEGQHRRQEKLKKDEEWKAKRAQEEADKRAA